MSENELDALYASRPEDFVALRNELATAAKVRGEADRAKLIRAVRKPTTAAWVVNLLVHTNPDARCALADLGERLRTAYSAIDGDSVRQLSAEQRSLISELAWAAFDAAEQTRPSVALRDDVAATLRAAIADPDLAARLGRLTKAQRWYGFGGFAVTAPVSAKKATSKAEAAPTSDSLDGEAEELRRQRVEAENALAEAKRAHDEADEVLRWLGAEHTEAKQYLDALRRQVGSAEAQLAKAASEYDKAQLHSRDAVQRVKDARALLRALPKA